jgi:hypothetical protein
MTTAAQRVTIVPPAPPSTPRVCLVSARASQAVPDILTAIPPGSDQARVADAGSAWDHEGGRLVDDRPHGRGPGHPGRRSPQPRQVLRSRARADREPRR